MDLKANPIHEAHQPGWEVDGEGHSYIVWAPRPGRPHWQVDWTRDGGLNGDGGRGDVLATLLDTIPRDEEGRAARVALEAAVAGWMEGLPLPRCPHGCRGRMDWADDQYRCSRCGDEWHLTTILAVER